MPVVVGIWILIAVFSKIAMMRLLPGYGDALKDWLTLRDPMALAFVRRFWRVQLLWFLAMLLVGLILVMAFGG